MTGKETYLCRFRLIYSGACDLFFYLAIGVVVLFERLLERAGLQKALGDVELFASLLFLLVLLLR